jgi:predicted TIM-barrel fold metal-dependent hydrolase
MPSRLIDTHPHIISVDAVRYPITPLGGKRSKWSEERPIDFAGLVASMNAAGVDKAAIVHSSTTYGYDNSYLADAIADHHERFAGVFSVEVRDAGAPQKISDWVGRGLSGLRLFAAGSTVKASPAWIADPATWPAWKRCSELGIPIAISVRLDGIPFLHDMLQRYPDVRVIMDHLMLTPIDDGPPYQASAELFGLADYRNVYMKLTTNNVRRSRSGKATPETFFGQLVRAFGSTRITWGSNFPNETGTLAEQVAEARRDLAFLPAADQHNILAGTAMSLYPSLAD